MSKDRITAIGRGDGDLGGVIPWINASGETIPAYGVVQFRENLVANMSQAKKPDSTEGLFFVNGPVAVASGKYGESLLWTRPREVLMPAGINVGDEVGPTASSWQMSLAGSGFRVLRESDSGLGRGIVVPVGQGSSGPSIIRFQIYEADCEARSAVGRILSRNGSVVGEFEIYGETELDEEGNTVPSKFVYVYDKNGCYLNESNRNLFGRIGHASYLYGSPKYPYQPWWSYEIIGICEQQTECEAF